MCDQSNPIRKRVETPIVDRIAPSDVIHPVYDTQAVPENAGNIDFFPAQPTGSKRLQNYQSNPLPGDYARKVYGASVNATVQSIRSDDPATVDVDGILNEFRQAVLEITADSDESLLLRTHLHKVMALDEAQVTTSVASDGTVDVSTSRLTLPPTGIQLFENPFRLGNNQVFQARILFESGAAFPVPANYVNQALALKVELLTVAA